jgi:hypothetical protein
MRAKERALIPSPLVVFTFGLVIESIKEFEGVSILIFEGLFIDKIGPKVR